MLTRNTWPTKLLLGSLFVLIASSGHSQNSRTTPREQLRQYVAQLQQNPNDNDLREKIIKLALTIEPAPEIPDEAKENEGAAEWAFKHAQNKDDFASAAKQYQKSLLVAPWVARDYFNLALYEEKAGLYDKAITNYNLYILAAPDAKDHDEVIKKIGAMKYAAEHTTPAAEAAKQEEQRTEEQEDSLKSVDGACFVHETRNDDPHSMDAWHIEKAYIVIHGNGLQEWHFMFGGSEDGNHFQPTGSGCPLLTSSGCNSNSSLGIYHWKIKYEISSDRKWVDETIWATGGGLPPRQETLYSRTNECPPQF